VAESNKRLPPKAVVEGKIDDLQRPRSAWKKKVFNLEQARMQNEAAFDDLNTLVAVSRNS
jgi:hypothetical protein